MGWNSQGFFVGALSLGIFLLPPSTADARSVEFRPPRDAAGTSFANARPLVLSTDGGAQGETPSKKLLIFTGKNGTKAYFSLVQQGGNIAVKIPVDFAVLRSGFQMMFQGKSEKYTSGEMYIFKNRIYYWAYGGSNIFNDNEDSQSSSFNKGAMIGSFHKIGGNIHLIVRGRVDHFRLIVTNGAYSNGSLPTWYQALGDDDPLIADLNFLITDFDEALPQLEALLGYNENQITAADLPQLHIPTRQEVEKSVRQSNPSFFQSQASSNSGSNPLLGGLFAAAITQASGGSDAQMLSAFAQGTAVTANSQASGQPEGMSLLQGIAAGTQQQNIVPPTSASVASVSTPISIASGNSYAEMSPAQKQELANELKAKSSQDCAIYDQEARQGVVRASYEAAACLYGTYYLGVPSDYPGRENLKQQYYANVEQAKKFNSTASVISLIP